MELLAILGRGIQRLREEDPAEDIESWQLTPDLEVCHENGSHLPVCVPADDAHPSCLVGGGQMNLDAGRILIQQHEPKVVVCAYGDRSTYLKSVDGPSESEVMSEALRRSFTDQKGRWSPVTDEPEIVVWPRTRSHPLASNTRQELLNIFDLALERKLTRIGLVTVGVHVPRTATFVARHISTRERREYRTLSPVVFESEEVLLETSDGWRDRVDALRNSQAFGRNLEREARGISAALRGAYNSVKETHPSVAAQ